MPRSLVALVACAVAVVSGVATALPAQALRPVPLSGTNESLFAWSNLAAPDEGDAVAAIDEVICPPSKPLPAASKTESAAIARAFAALNTIEGSKDLAAIAKVMKPLDVQTHADTLLTLGLAGRMGGAAAVSLHLARKSKDRAHLVNAAALMLHFDRITEAHDLMVWASRRKPGPSEDGTSQAAFESAWGEIYQRLGRPAEARQRFEAANTAYPLSTSPRLGVARAWACLGKDGEAARWWARGQRAIDLPETFEEDLPLDTPTSRRAPNGIQPRWKIILIEPLFDPNDGIGGAKFASYSPPDNARVPAMFPFEMYEKLGEVMKDGEAYYPSPVRLSRYHRLLNQYAIRLTTSDRSVRILTDMIDVQIGRVIDAASNGPNDLGCGAADNYATYWNAVRRIYELHQDLADRYHEIWTAAAKQTANPAVVKYFNQVADEYVYSMYEDFYEYLGGATQWDGDNVAGHATDAAFRVEMNDAAREAGADLLFPECTTSFLGMPQAEVKDTDKPTVPGDQSGCNDKTGGAHVKLALSGNILKKLPVSLEVKANCDSVSAELTGPKVGFPLAGLKGFLSYEDNVPANRVEVFGGVKGEFGGEMLGVSVTAGVVFVYEMGMDGPEIADVRWKSETTLGASDGENLGFETKKTLTVSFVNGAIGT